MSAEWNELAEYLAGELDAAREEELERELFEDAHAPAVVEGFLEVVDGVAELRAMHGTLSAGMLGPELDRLRERANVLELDIPVGEIIAAPLPEDVDVCVAHLAVDLAGVGAVDVEFVDAKGATYFRSRDVPVDRDNDRVVVACERHIAMIEETTVFRLVTHDREGRRVLGDYGIRNLPPPGSS